MGRCMVGIVQHAIFRAATLAERRIAGTREFLVGGRIRFEAPQQKVLRTSPVRCVTHVSGPDHVKLAGATGLEPATSCVTGRRSNQTELRPCKLTKMTPRSLHSLAVSCTAFHLLRRDRASL